MIMNGSICDATIVTGTIAMRAFKRRVSFRVLNGVPGFVRGNAERGDRRRVVNVARKAKLLARRIVMIAQEIVRLDHLDIVNLRRLQNFPRAFRAGDVGARPHLAPFLERAADAKLRPNADDQRHAQYKASQ